MKKIILILILALAFFLRFYKLGSYPALNADEAAIGYNAYSLIETGKDEHGNAWPIDFQSFNDYKPGLYFYMVLPFVRYMGLNVSSVRIPNALFAVASVYLIYLLVIELFSDKEPGFSRDSYALSAAFLLAVSPWHIHFSRGGWEVNVATFFILAGLLLFLKGLKKHFYLFWAMVLFSLSLYTYHAARIVVPLLGLGIVIIFRSEILAKAKYFIIALFIGVLVSLPLMRDLTRPEIRSRVAGVGLFADPGPIERTNEQRSEHKDYNALFPRLLHNKVVNYGLEFIKNWTDHYHGVFLFISGDVIQRNKVPETGEMYLFDIFFVIAGLSAMVRSFSTNPKSYALIIWWLVVAPTAAALTFQSPHALRAENMVIPLVLISALGLTAILDWLNKRKKYLKIFGIILVSIFISWNFSRYLHMYWVHMARQYPFSSQYGMKQLAGFIEEEGGKYQNVVITTKYDQPYILILFYLKYPPQLFQKEHVLTPRDKYGFSTVDSFDKFVFKAIDWDKDKIVYPNSLIVGADEEIPNEANIVKAIYGENGYLYFKVVAN
jgi:4-amino-4-deoxy-L-arabinose transferase-like glycosyltransferase